MHPELLLAGETEGKRLRRERGGGLPAVRPDQADPLERRRGAVDGLEIAVQGLGIARHAPGGEVVAQPRHGAERLLDRFEGSVRVLRKQAGGAAQVALGAGDRRVVGGPALETEGAQHSRRGGGREHDSLAAGLPDPVEHRRPSRSLAISLYRDTSRFVTLDNSGLRKPEAA